MIRKPATHLAVTLTAVNLVGYSAMAGPLAAAEMAIRYGWRFHGDVMLQTVVILVLLVKRNPNAGR